MIDTPLAPPKSALLERQLLADNVPACGEFYRTYFDPGCGAQLVLDMRRYVNPPAVKHRWQR